MKSCAGQGRPHVCTSAGKSLDRTDGGVDKALRASGSGDGGQYTDGVCT